MFVRRKKNKNGVISVQVIDKSSGKYRVVKSLGSSADKGIIGELVQQGALWIRQQSKAGELDFEGRDALLEELLGSITEVRVAGIELLLGRIFDEIGFNKIQDELFRKLVMARLCYPASKLKTTEYLRHYENYHTDEDKIYRYLDKLHSTQKRTVQQISYQHTLSILNYTVQIVFYDVTTLYFEIEAEDELRKTGFSKDGKHQNPQLVLGLLVSQGGYPLAYEVFKGNKFEGHSMLPVLNLFRRKYQLKQLVVIADAGLLSHKNITALEQNHYEYILGARLKNESDAIKKQILALGLQNGQSMVIQKDEHTCLVVSYSEARAKKDANNREKGLARLEKLIETGKLTKAQINNKGYNRFLQMHGSLTLALNREKIEQDKKWDGLKGYLTNTALTKEEIIENYSHLWMIEKAFRVTKTDIKIRPVYHQLPERIQAHICLCFVAYKVYKELERQLKERQSDISPQRAIEIAKTIYAIKAIKPTSKELFERVLILNEEQHTLLNLFNP